MTNEETIIVAAKRIPGLTELTLKNDLVVDHKGMLFDIWNEIAKANNFKQVEIVLHFKIKKLNLKCSLKL